MSFFQANRDIRKVRKTQHQFPEFGHTQGEIQNTPAKNRDETQFSLPPKLMVFCVFIPP
jgi:hypothetical protein